MSNRFSNQNSRNQIDWKGFTKVQKQFIPKRETAANQTLTTSLRQSDATPSSAVGGGSAVEAVVGSRLIMGEDGSKIHSGSYMNYLPQDEAVASGLGPDEGGLDPVESQRVVDLLNRELSRLLKLNPRDFWKEVARDTSLHAFLESFLKYKSRWYDFPYRGSRGIVAGVIVGEFELSRRVFMVLYRISSNRDPHAKSADSLSSKDHAALLQEKKLLDLPKLFDICALYGHENEDLTRLLVLNAIRAQRWLHDEFTAVTSHFLSIFRTMYQRCISSLEVLFSSGNLQDQEVSRLRADYLEVMDFINDAVVNMDAFIGAYKHAAVFFCCPVEMSYGNEELLTTLARIHDSLLPSLQRGLRIVLSSRDNGLLETYSDMVSDVLISYKLLAMRIIKFGWKLLYFCYLSEEAFDNSVPFPTSMKMFPANVDDPVIRTDILVQTLRDISQECTGTSDGDLRGTFLQNIEKNHKIMSRVELLQKTGWMSIDTEQGHLLTGTLRHPLRVNSKDESQIAFLGTGASMKSEEDAAILESKISQIKDLFPDYGKGFLAACLEVYNQNPEDVIQRILEGTLHEDLQSMDTSLEQMPQKKHCLVSTSGKGKAIHQDSELQTMADQKADHAEGLSISSSSSSTYQPEGPSNLSSSSSRVGRLAYERLNPPNLASSSSTAGRFIRKTGTHLHDDDDILDSKDEKYMVKNSYIISQMEYEDEYDDSFDDLGLNVGDSGVLEETENLRDKLTSDHGKSREAVDGSSGSSKWNSRKNPQYYVKDGKNYSYKVQGSVAVSNYNEATLVNQVQRETIHGLGRGGNIPVGAVRRLTEPSEEMDAEPEVGGGVAVRGGRGNFRGRGRRGGRTHYRKDQAMKKHFSGVIG